MPSIAYHPESDTLAQFALGTASAGIELLVSSHLTFCPDCRKTVERYETLGGAALVDAPETEITAPVLSAIIDQLTATEPETVEAPRPFSALFPAALLDFVPSSEDDVDWTFRLPGIYEYELEGFGDENVSLLRAKPGSKMLSHTHESEELTLILSGEMADGPAIYRKGDVAVADDTADHKPHIVGNETCICLIVMSGKMKFTGTMGRALNILMR